MNLFKSIDLDSEDIDPLFCIVLICEGIDLNCGEIDLFCEVIDPSFCIVLICEDIDLNCGEIDLFCEINDHMSYYRSNL